MPRTRITFKPVEFIFPEGESFKHYNMKWVDYEKMNVVIVDNAAIEKKLRDYTTRMFVEFGIRGYARTRLPPGQGRRALHARDQSELRHLLSAGSSRVRPISP